MFGRNFRSHLNIRIPVELRRRVESYAGGRRKISGFIRSVLIDHVERLDAQKVKASPSLSG